MESSLGGGTHWGHADKISNMQPAFYYTYYNNFVVVHQNVALHQGEIILFEIRLMGGVLAYANMQAQR